MTYNRWRLAHLLQLLDEISNFSRKLAFYLYLFSYKLCHFFMLIFGSTRRIAWYFCPMHFNLTQILIPAFINHYNFYIQKEVGYLFFFSYSLPIFSLPNFSMVISRTHEKVHSKIRPYLHFENYCHIKVHDVNFSFMVNQIDHWMFGACLVFKSF
jgi:hypothetical protein